VGAFNARVRLAPLLHKQVVVDSVSAERLTVRVIKREDGTFNFSSLVAASTSASRAQTPAATTPSGAEVSLAVRRFKLAGGSIVYEEVGSKNALTVGGLEAKAQGFSLKGPFPAELSARVTGRWEGRPVDGAMSFSGKLDLGGQDPRAFVLQAKMLELSASGWTARISGGLKGLAEPSADVTLSVRGPSGPIGEGAFAGAVVLPQGAKPLNLRGRFSLSSPGLPADRAAAYGLPSPVPPLKLSAQASLTPTAATFQSLAVETSAGRVDASGSVVGLGSAKPTADLAVSASLELPAIRSEDAPWLKLPKGVTLPPMKVDGKARVKGDDLELSNARVRTAAGSIEASGSIQRLASGAPQPNVDVTAKFSLPALKSADIPMAGVPPGLSMPASQWDVGAAVSLDEVKVRALRAVIGHNDFQIDNARLINLRSGKPAVSVLIKCRKFQLDELTAMSELTKDMKLTGSGFFALGLSGKLPRPVLEGKLQFKDIGADVAGLKLAGFTGTASFNEKKIDVPNLRGQVADGELQMDLTIKNYVNAPDVNLEGALTRVDLAKFLAAKAALTKEAARPAAPSEPQGAALPQKPPLSAKGKFVLQQLVHPNAQARDIRLDWDLSDITPDLKRIGGRAKVSSSGGRFTDLGSIAIQSKIAKVLLYPVIVVQRIATLGLFNFDKVEYSELEGDYRFHEGVMELADSHIFTSIGQFLAAGSINLPAETLNLGVTAKVGNIAPVEVAVTGTFDKPQTKVQLIKSAANLIEGLLKR
jgi:hypothetical protein